jgi:L-fucose isomerase-like protein
MGTIMPMSQTTACLPLSLLNDAGYLAFCESDFVVIPSGILLHYISGRPVFLNDPTFPHDKIVTLAHCTAPRKMDGRHAEPARILTHFESDYGAAPKVEMRIGQKVTNIAPDFSFKRWVGFDGKIIGNPFMAICRSQIDVEINGGSDRLMEMMQGFHWMTCYGDYMRETGYALQKLGIEWMNVRLEQFAGAAPPQPARP